MTVTFGTVASAYAKRSLAPFFMIPPCSWPVPGRKPGTSTNVSRGMEKASQNRTNRAAFSELDMSRHPARVWGLFPTTPTVRPSILPNAVTMFLAWSGCISNMEPWSITSRITSLMSYGWLGSSGTSMSSAGATLSGSSVTGRTGRVDRSLLSGRYPRRVLTALIAATSLGYDPCATPLVPPAWTDDPPRSSFVTSSFVTVRTTSGPVTNMYDVSSTMNMKSVMAGLYTAPPAQGPMTTETWGTTPDASTLRWKMSAYPARLSVPSCIRAPPESLRPTTGERDRRAMSMTLPILRAWASPSDPP
mmetsp:Transcript_28353/g.64521  ORF Transcript_28353/g.64521 Transcript_28353/m.64521 type:complete len:304 (-) Transcript_28353:74-985(-)